MMDGASGRAEELGLTWHLTATVSGKASRAVVVKAAEVLRLLLLLMRGRKRWATMAASSWSSSTGPVKGTS